MRSVEELIDRRIRYSVTIQILHFDLQYQISHIKDFPGSTISDAIKTYDRKSDRYIYMLRWLDEAIELIQQGQWEEAVSKEIAELVGC